MTEDYKSLEDALIGTWTGQYRVLECALGRKEHVGLVGIFDKMVPITDSSSPGYRIVFSATSGYSAPQCHASKIEKVYE